MNDFTIFAAMDLMGGRVVRLQEGDPKRKTCYPGSPVETALRWTRAGAEWLHVINLDGAFGMGCKQNLAVLEEILAAFKHNHRVRIQYGGGVRSVEQAERLLNMGVERIVVSTLAFEQPERLGFLLSKWGVDRVAVSLDCHNGSIRVRGWQNGVPGNAGVFGQEWKEMGLGWIVYTDISCDGMQRGGNIRQTVELARTTGLKTIASGGVSCLKEISEARMGELAGVIVGKALYEEGFDLVELFQFGKWLED